MQSISLLVFSTHSIKALISPRKKRIPHYSKKISWESLTLLWYALVVTTKSKMKKIFFKLPFPSSQRPISSYLLMWNSRLHFSAHMEELKHFLIQKIYLMQSESSNNVWCCLEEKEKKTWMKWTFRRNLRRK